MTQCLLPYQREDVDWLLHDRQGRALLSHDQGLGKTIITSTYIGESDSWPALIVCPASVKAVWQKELADWAGAQATQIHGEKHPDIDPATIQAAIVNYDILKAQMPYLCQIPYKVIVFDECHTLSNRQAKWTKAAMLLARRTTKVLGLSGTPITNRPSDFWPTLHLIQPKLFPSFNKYAWTYCDPKMKPWGGGWDYTGASNLEQLHEEIKPFTRRRLKSVELKLPKRSISMERVEHAFEDEYGQAEADFLKYLATSGKANRIEKAKKALAITKMNALLMLAAKSKAKGVVHWCQKWLQENPDKKLVIFAVNHLMIDVLYRRVLPGQAVVIDGTVATKKRGDIVAQFQTDPNIRVFIGNVTAAGTGITLTAASCTAFAQLPWLPGKVLQAQDRAYRIGQDKEVEQVFLVLPGSIEEKLCLAIETKQNVSDSILEGKASKSMDLFTLLQGVA